MAYTRYLYPKHNFVLTMCTGFIDDNALLIHLMSLRAESKKFSVVRELIDMRQLRKSNRMTVEGMLRIADLHRSLFEGTDFRAAVLADAPITARIIDLYSQLVNMEGLEVSLFKDSIDAPLAYLGYAYNAMTDIETFVRKHTAEATPCYTPSIATPTASRMFSEFLS